ncbi:hypothetical protein Tco_1037027, partial [Tanacetum coccineum]
FSLQGDGIRGLLDSFYVVIKMFETLQNHVYLINELCGYVLWKSSQDFTRPLGPPSGLKGLLHTLNATVIPTKLYRLMKKLLVMVDVARGSRLGAWLKACCLFIVPSKSRGVIRSNSNPSYFKFSILMFDSSGGRD